MGAITELVGAECTGRTTATLAYMAAITRGGGVCAWVDVGDALDLESAAASGVELESLLWVRCGAAQELPRSEHSPCPQPMAAGAKEGSQKDSQAEEQPPRHTGGGSPHPRTEGRDMPQAIKAMMSAHGGLYDRQMRREKKQIGTPGAPNRPLMFRSEEREEQIATDRLPLRRGDNLALAPRCAESQPRTRLQVASHTYSPTQSAQALPHKSTSPWRGLDQALRATDLLLQSGGFSALVLDLGSTPPEFSWRIPLATWFRFRAACERTRASLLLLTQHPCARSAAELVVRLEHGTLEAQGRVMTGIRYQAEVARNRSESSARVVPIRKPPQPERPGSWNSEAAWFRA